MAYIKTNWKDQKVERPKTYELQENSDGTYTLLDRFGQTNELGTPVNALNMNHIEEGIDACALRKYNPKETFKFKEAVLGEVNDELIVCRSLQDGNVGHELTDENYWRRINISFIPLATDEEIGGVTLDTVNQSKAMETGSISNNPEVYNDIYKYAHSTFDLSKFTVVGSPTITDDGVASGFSTENYLIIENIGEKLKQSKNWKIEFRVIFKDGTTTTRQEILGGRNTTNPYPLFIQLWQDGLIKVFTNGINNNTDTAITLSSKAQAQANKEYVIKVFVENNVLYFYLNGELQGSHTISENISFDDIITIGRSQPVVVENVFQGSIDLKQFSITVDGVEVFSGNKTGIDIIKPDNYEVVGSPTISEDGVASGFASNSRIRPPKFNDYTDNFEIETKFRLSSIPAHNVRFYRAATNRYDGAFSFSLEIGTTGYMKLSCGVEKTYNKVLELNKDYKAKLKYSNNNFNVYLDDKLVINVTNPTNIQLSYLSISYDAFDCGEIDLNAFKVYVDGKLIYQPCLKIPYTLSKTGSKIVDSVYRDRVADMYEQFGYAPYYTIDEENKNFTLPMGEIYGMIEKTRQNLDDILRPIGKPLMSMNEDKLLPDEIWLEGDKVLKSTYPKLTAKYGDNYAPLEAEDTDTYLYLPDCRDKTAWGSPDGSFGYIEAGLPNITGSFDGGLGSGNGDGAFESTERNSTYNPYQGSFVANMSSVTFDASRSSDIYGKSNTVQTPSFKVRWKTRFK